jgi:hypothetical protein
MQEVREEKCYMMKLSDVKFKACPYPPTNDYLQKEICKRIRGHDYGEGVDTGKYFRLIHYLEKYTCDQHWLLGVCATIHPKMEIFERSYRPKIEQKAGAAQPFVSNEDGFFSGLPMLSQKELKKRGNIRIVLSKEQ